MEGDTIKYEAKFTFVFVRVKIKRDDEKNRKVVVKVGEKEKVMGKLGDPMVFQLRVMYSKIMQQYYPMKGIIKIYEVMQNGKEIINHVGAFQIQSIFYHPSCTEVFRKELGCIELEFKVTGCLDLDEVFQPKLQCNIIDTSQIKTTTKTKHEYEDSHLCAYLLEQSSIPHHHSTSNLSISCPQLLQEYQRDEMEYLGRELIAERHKNKQLQEQIEVLNLKLQLSKKKDKQSQNELQSLLQHIDKLKNFIEGQREINEEKCLLYLRYNDAKIVESFDSIMEMSKKYQGKKVQKCKQIDIMEKVNQIYQSQKNKKEQYEKQILKQKATIEKLMQDNKEIKEVVSRFQMKKKDSLIEGKKGNGVQGCYTNLGLSINSKIVS